MKKYQKYSNGKRTPLFSSYDGMMNRCYQPSYHAFHRYGGRGIKVCKRWHSFKNFVDDMGGRPEGKSLDRKNNDRDYKPSNCQWLDHPGQCRNRSTTKLTPQKVKVIRRQIIAGLKDGEICGAFSVDPSTINRIRRGDAWA